jgi:putative endonuclease
MSFGRARYQKVINMYFTYVLRCIDLKTNIVEFYTGYSKSLPDRLDDHKSKSVTTTKSFDTVELVYYEACLNKYDAMKREIQLKSGFGRGYIKRRLENYLKDTRD